MLPRTCRFYGFRVKSRVLRKGIMAIDRDPPRTAIRHVVARSLRTGHRAGRYVEAELADGRDPGCRAVVRLVGRIVRIGRRPHTTARCMFAPTRMTDFVSHRDLTATESRAHAAGLAP